jgi:PAS domain S-box-containing protein
MSKNNNLSSSEKKSESTNLSFFESKEVSLYPLVSTLFASIKSPILIIDQQGVIKTASNSFFSLFSLNEFHIENQKITDFLVDTDKIHFQKLLDQNNFQPGISVQIPMTGTRRDGSTIPISVSINTVDDQLAKLYLMIIDDRSDLFKGQEKIEKLEHQAAIGTFTSGIAHEFNNLLTGIRGYSQLAKSDINDTALISKAFSIIEQETSRGAELCKNLSLYSGSKRLNLEPVDLTETILNALELQKGFFAGTSIVLNTELRELPSLMADKNRMQQVLINLITNARHAIIPKGSGTITIRLFSDNDSVVIQIEDDGIGIPPHHISRIFDPFYTNKGTGIESGQSHEMRGTGLGLTVCQVIVKQHGGTIDVASKADAGTTFTIHLPLKYAQVFPGTYNQTSANINETYPKIKALVVDDEMAVREVIFRALSHSNVETFLARNATELEESVANQCVDIIFLDYVLPEMNADRILPLLREKCPTTRIVIVSGWNGSPQKKLQLEKMVDAWIEKPFNVEAIIEQIRLMR